MGVDAFAALGIDPKDVANAPPSPGAAPVGDGVPTMRITPQRDQDNGGVDAFTALGISPEAVKAAPPTPPPGAQAPQSQGIAANVAAGANKAIFGAAGAPVDVATGALNLGARGINALAGTHLGQIENPVGGSQWLGQQFGRISRDPNAVQPTNEAERIGQAVGGSLAQVPLLGAGGLGLARMGGLPGAVGQTVADSAGTTVGSAAVANAGAAAGGGLGQGAADAVPDRFKPYADLAGNLAGGGLVGGAVKAGQLGGRYLVRPLQSMGAGAKEAVADNIRATPAQIENIGQQLQAGMGPEGRVNLAKSLEAEPQARAIEQKLQDPSLHPDERQNLQGQLDDLQKVRANLVPNSQPTTAELANTTGAKDLETAAKVANGPGFEQRLKDRNNARLTAINANAPDGNPYSVGQAVADHLASLEHEATVDTNTARNDLAGQPALAAGQQKTQTYGESMRAQLQGAAAPWQRAYRALFAAVDPEGKWALASDPLRDAAIDLRDNVSPTSDTDPGVARLIQRGASLPNVVPFADLGQMRADANWFLKKLSGAASPNEPEVRRLTLFKKGIDDTIAKAINDHAATDPSVTARLQAEFGDVGAGAGTAGAVGGSQPASVPAGALGGSAGGVGTGGAGPGGQQNPGSNRAVPLGAANPNRAPRQPETLVDHIIGLGGMQDPTGDLAAMDADRIHHQMGGRLVNPNGLHPDKVVESAQQEGFLPQSSNGPNPIGINDLYDKIREHTMGNPTYRGQDAAAVAERASGAYAARANARFEDQMYDARDRVNAWVDQQGLPPLAPEEQNHAARLVTQGMHPEDAIRSASAETEQRVLDANAQKSAFGAPGVHPAAQQAAMDVSGQTGRLTPNMTPEDAAIYSGATGLYKDYADRFKSGGVGKVLQRGNAEDGFRVEAGNVPRQIFTGGKNEPRRVEQWINAVGGMDAAQEIGRDILARDLRDRNIIGQDGTVNEGKLRNWIAARQGTLDQFPQLKQEFGDLANAQATLTKVQADHAERLKEFAKSAAAKWIGADPDKAVPMALSGPNPTKNFTDLVGLTRGKPDADAGLKRAVVNYIIRQFKTAVPSDDGMDMMSVAGFRKFIDTNKGPLRALFGGQGMQNLEMVAADMRRQAAGPTAVAGSQTTPHASRAARLGIAAGHGANTTLLALLGEHLSEHFAGMGGVGAAVGAGAGMLGAHMFNKLRAAGIRTQSDLLAHAMLNPAFAKAAMERVDARKGLSELAQRRLISALQGGVMASASNGEQRQ